MILDIADLDVVYLSYDEPQKEEFWIKIQNMVPWAKRVDGVKGSDAAHKAAADASTTERFVLIDGDNMPYECFFSEQLTLTEETEHSVFRWKAINDINGLAYGNGGLSCWTKTYVNSMNTHESATESDHVVDFLIDNKSYIPMWNIYSNTYPNGDAYHAWRAGFREGVKMVLNHKGQKPSLEEFDQLVNSHNLDRLLIWMSVGNDAPFGIHAMAGAMYGTYLTMLTDWDHTEVQDFDNLAKIYASYQKIEDTFEIVDQLKSRLNLPIVMYTPEQSKFFKHFYCGQHRREDIMTTELDVIRTKEGW